MDVAALDGPSMTVLSGGADEIAAMARRLTEAGIVCRPLRTAHAFHSSSREPARDKLAALLESVPRQAPSVTIVSNRTGAALTADQATSGEYWSDHLVSPVRFAQSVRQCMTQGADVFVELGAGQTLGGLVRQQPEGARRAAGAPPSVFTCSVHSWTGQESRNAR